ncbi:hypothetical protein Btru_056851 [Bulinus truncatus]|nr:hypothetical protein Btru_056851 [Bulinus truncatus]
MLINTRRLASQHFATCDSFCTYFDDVNSMGWPAASTLRRRSSASGALLGVPSSGGPPLPDIVPTTGRDRSNSVPDFHAYERAARETGRQVGRELRRMSDEFNSVSFLGVRRLVSRSIFFRGLVVVIFILYVCGGAASPVSEDFNGYSSSFPITRPRGFLHRVRSFIQENIGRGGLRRQDSSVDLTEQPTPEDDASSPQSDDRTPD